MLILTKEDVQKCFSMKEAIEISKQALAMYTAGDAQVPLRTNLDVALHEGQSLYMPAYANGDVEALGVKIVSAYPKNIDKGLPSIPATMVVLDPETGIVSAMIDGTYLTQLRTGAVQGAGTDLLARQDATVGALIGTGGQAASQLEAMLTARPLKEVRVFDINLERAQAFVAQMEELLSEFETTFIALDDISAVVQGADVITTVTTSKQPTFKAEDVKEGAHINGVGAYTPEMKEVPAGIIARADRIIFDTMDGVLAEAGDFISPLEDGVVTEADYHGELGQVVREEVAGRASDKDITIFKTVGSAVLDIVTAQAIVNKAKEQGIGLELDV